MVCGFSSLDYSVFMDVLIHFSILCRMALLSSGKLSEIVEMRIAEVVSENSERQECCQEGGGIVFESTRMTGPIKTMPHYLSCSILQ